MRTYKPQRAPRRRAGQSIEEHVAEVVDFIEKDSQNIQKAAEADTGGIRLQTLHAAPSKTTEGDIIAADGTDYNPGDGQGIYWFIDSAFSKIGPFLASVERKAKTADYLVTTTDRGDLIDVTSNSPTLTFTGAATLGASWYTFLRNSGTGDVLLDPTENMDGLGSFVMYPGEARMVTCDASVFTSVVLQGFSKTFTASGTFTKAPGYQRLKGRGWGSAGAGARAAGGDVGGGGGAAGIQFDLAASAFGATETVTVAPAVAGRSTTGNGADGTASSIGSVITFYGGIGGKTSGTGGGGAGALGPAVAGAGGGPDGGAAATGAAVAGSNDGFGGGGAGNSTFPAGGSSGYGGGGGGGGGSNSGIGGSSVYGGGGGGGGGTTNSGAGGASLFAGAGGAGSDSGSATAGAAPGGGGGGAGDSGTSGGGARGEIRIEGVV